MGIPIFLSFPKPHMKVQEMFVRCVTEHLRERGLDAKTLGATEYNIDAPLIGVRQLMMESNGALVVAFKRYWIENGAEKYGSDLSSASPGTGARGSISGKWMTSPWCHMESAMAFQLGLPLLILREKDVHDDGALQRGVTGYYLPEVDLSCPCDEYFKNEEWRQLIAQWEAKVRRVRELKGTPPLLERM